MRFFLFAFLTLLAFSGLSMASPANSAEILFDQGHGQVFTIDKTGELQLGKFADRLRSNGLKVDFTVNPLTPEVLNGVKALIISGAFKPLSGQEINAVNDFLENGGRLVVLLHIPHPVIPLLAKLKVASVNGVMREGDKSKLIEGEPLYFKVSSLIDHPITNGLKSFSIYGGWPLLPLDESVHTIASTGPLAWVDLNRDKILSGNDVVQEFGVLVSGSYGKGEFAIFADDAIFQNQFFRGENVKLADNLSKWLELGKTRK